MTTLRRFGSRLRQISRFSATGLHLSGKFKMAIAGYARGHPFSAPGIIGSLGRRLFPRITARTKPLNGLKFTFDPSEISHLVAADEILLEDVYPLHKVTFAPDVVIDCGANIGVFTLLAASRFPEARLIAFEPDPENIAFLREQIQMNRLSVDQVDAAVSDCDGQARFHAGLGIGSALASTNEAGRDTISVKTIRLSDYLEKLQPQRLVLKLDVEGAEEQIVPDIIQALPMETAIFFETHRGNESWNALNALLCESGFQVTKLRTHGPYSEGHAIRSKS